MLKEEIRLEEAAEMASWLPKHEEVMEVLCNDCYLTADKFIEIIEKLEEQQFYCLIYLAIVNCKPTAVVGNAVDKLMEIAYFKQWEKLGTKRMIEEIKAYVKKEAKRENRK
jgi:hypothetical protein